MDITRKALKRLHDLHAQLGDISENVRAEALGHIDKWLRSHGKTWNDVPELVHAYQTSTSPGTAADPRDAGATNPFAGERVTPADTVRAILQEYIVLERPEDYVAAALWPIHTHVYDRFDHTPRLLLTGLTGSGKTTLLKVLSRLVARKKLTASITAAAIYHATDREHCTLLADERDNLDPSAEGVMRAVLNAGWEKELAFRDLIWDGQPRRFNLFAPMALAGIGRFAHWQLITRSIKLRMMKHKRLRRYTPNDTADLDEVYRHIFLWVKSKKFNLDPQIPALRDSRHEDLWRPLIAVADACNKAWGVLAREAAIAFSQSAGWSTDEIPVLLVGDIKTVFDARGTDRISSEALCSELNAMDDRPWSDWRGMKGDKQPRNLTQNELARLLWDDWEIRPRSAWPLRRGPGDKSAKSYYREQFAKAWEAYCDEDGTPAQPINIKHLRGG
jgi:energy-coupling factor transporter ATP-binding protein EcfA2